MGSAYDFNLLMYFLALCIGTRCLPGYHGSYNTSQTVYARSNLSPPPASLCLPSSCLQLLLGLVSSSAPPCSTAESS